MEIQVLWDSSSFDCDSSYEEIETDQQGKQAPELQSIRPPEPF